MREPRHRALGECQREREREMEMRPGCGLGVLSVQGREFAVWVLSQTSYSCAAVFTNPKASHSIKQWVGGRAEGLRVAAAAPKPGRKKERDCVEEERSL